MGGVPGAAGAVPERQGQRPGAVQGHVDPSRGRSVGLCVGQADLSVREGEAVGLSFLFIPAQREYGVSLAPTKLLSSSLSSPLSRGRQRRVIVSNLRRRESRGC